MKKLLIMLCAALFLSEYCFGFDTPQQRMFALRAAVGVPTLEAFPASVRQPVGQIPGQGQHDTDALSIDEQASGSSSPVGASAHASPRDSGASDADVDRAGSPHDSEFSPAAAGLTDAHEQGRPAGLNPQHTSSTGLNDEDLDTHSSPQGSRAAGDDGTGAGAPFIGAAQNTNRIGRKSRSGDCRSNDPLPEILVRRFLLVLSVSGVVGIGFVAKKIVRVCKSAIALKKQIQENPKDLFLRKKRRALIRKAVGMGFGGLVLALCSVWSGYGFWFQEFHLRQQ